MRAGLKDKVTQVIAGVIAGVYENWVGVPQINDDWAYTRGSLRMLIAEVCGWLTM